MKSNFMNFLEYKLTKENLSKLLNQINDIDNLTINDLNLISKACNCDYETLVTLYLNDFKRFHNLIFIKEALRNNDIEALRRIILERHIIVSENRVYIQSIGNKLRKYYLDENVYQELLKKLIEADEIELAEMISYGNNYYKDYNNGLLNIERYLCGCISPNNECSVPAWLTSIYDDLNSDLKDRVHTILMQQYEKSYKKLVKLKNIGKLERISNGIIISLNKEDKRYYDDFIYIPDIYKKFDYKDVKFIEENFGLN